MSYDPQLFRSRLKSLRKQKKMSQKALAQALNVSRGAVCNWELGYRTPDLSILGAIADIFDSSISYILGFTEIKENFLTSLPFSMPLDSAIPMYIYTCDKNTFNLIWANKPILDLIGYKQADYFNLNLKAICEKTNLKISDDLEIHICKDKKGFFRTHVTHKIKTPEHIYYLSILHYLS